MKKKAFLLLILLTGALSASPVASMQTFSADFEQHIVNAQKSQITYRGKLFAKRAHNRALWIYTAPVDKRICYNSGEVVIIEPELEQAILARLDKVPNIITLLQKAKRTGPGRYVTTFNNIHYTIIFKEGILSEIRYTDELHNRVTIRFRHQETDRAVPDAKFACKIPAGYDILQQK